jgi:hypothetical protein
VPLPGAARKRRAPRTISLTGGLSLGCPRVSIPCVRHRDRARVSGANHLDQARIAHLPGHKTAKAISASNADAESNKAC